ncbi:GMC oxidoreductase [Streptomyces sp. NPDC002671]
MPASPDIIDIDVLIVGSGPVGSAFARVIADELPWTRILMVDAGPQISHPPGSHVNNIPDQAQRAKAQAASQGPHPSPYPELSLARRLGLGGAGGVPDPLLAGTHRVAEPAQSSLVEGMPGAAMSTNVGGMGAHWACGCPRPGDGERIVFIDPPMWELALTRAEQLLHVTRHAFGHSHFVTQVTRLVGNHLNAGRPPERRVQPTPLAVSVGRDGAVRWCGPDMILGDLVQPTTATSFELRAQTLCRRVLMDGATARGAELEHLPTGRRRMVTARAVVVAADSLRTPQLLYASGVRPQALGRHLNDHPMVITAVRLHPGLAAELGSTTALMSAQDNAPMPLVWVPYSDTRPFSGQIMYIGQIPATATGTGQESPGEFAGLSWSCAKQLRAKDRITFSGSRRDALGMPAMQLHYGLSDVDQATIAAARKEASHVAALLGTPIGTDLPALLPAGSSLHYQGTVRMGATDDSTTVCDSSSRVWGTTNLYVGGNGVIPTTTACNPTLTSVALAVLAARALVRRHLR